MRTCVYPLFVPIVWLSTNNIVPPEMTAGMDQVCRSGLTHSLEYFFLLLIPICCLLLLVYWIQLGTRRKLEGGTCRLPTVIWIPRFLNYTPLEDENQKEGTKSLPKKLKLGSSAITGILPKMERLGGPYGMFGTVYGLNTMVVHMAHPTPVRQVLMGIGGKPSSPSSGRRSSSVTTSAGATKSPAYNHFKNFSGDGVFTSDGDEWKAKRASVIHCLLKGINGSNSDASRRLEREVNRSADRFVRDVEKIQSQANIMPTEQDLSDNGNCAGFNVVPVMQRTTVELIYRFITHDEKSLDDDSFEEDNMSCQTNGCLDGTDQDDETDDSSNDVSSTISCSSASDTSSEKNLSQHLCSAKVQGDLNESSQHKTTLIQSYLQSVTKIRMIILAQSRSFWFLLPRWVYRTFSSMFQEEEETMGPIRKFAMRAYLRAKPGSPLAMLQKQPSHSDSKMVKEKGFPESIVSKAMLDEAITLLFAGQDTSAATLSWTLHLLSLHPDIQQRLIEEIRMVMKTTECDWKKDGSMSKKSISKMPFLDAVLKESMRLYPVAPFIVRKLPEPLEIPAEKDPIKSPTILPAGSLACIWIYGLHRNKQLWDRPDEFIPDRWIDPQLRERDKGQNNGAFMPFAAGPRNCVGQPLAHVILRIMLARILLEYNVVDDRLQSKQLKNGKETNIDPLCLRKDMQAGFTVLPVGGVQLTMLKR
uniref:Cytochrome P450 n=2 Tax=Attheya septentrionalis TaxID=420275 RepID=A0A7S2UL92_9STRA|mmetsp:Transcript_2818/g.5126  ORF Transcript_2818/g.5126 Transcript_2818/m.5126 type:complete len:700 (+) Transcript_2818:83-2182(+)